MKVCIFGAASDKIDKMYTDRVEALAKKLGERGHSLVFGAGAKGIMGAAAKGFYAAGAEITGVIPSFFKEEQIEAIFEHCTNLIYTETMNQRKNKMEDLSDIFIIAPGGIGTYEELFEVLTLKQLGRHKKPIVFYNIDGYYNDLMSFMKHATDEGFIRHNCSILFKCTEDDNKLIDYIENPEPLNYTVKDMKRGW